MMAKDDVIRTKCKLFFNPVLFEHPGIGTKLDNPQVHQSVQTQVVRKKPADRCKPTSKLSMLT